MAGLFPGFNSSSGLSSPCANPTLAATGVDVQDQIAVTDNMTRSQNSVMNPALGLMNALLNFTALVQTGGPYDYKNQPGPGTQQQRTDAGNIAYGASCPFGALACQIAAGLNQLYRGNPGPVSTYFDDPRDNAMIKQGQAMKAAGCHS